MSNWIKTSSYPQAIPEGLDSGNIPADQKFVGRQHTEWNKTELVNTENDAAAADGLNISIFKYHSYQYRYCISQHPHNSELTSKRLEDEVCHIKATRSDLYCALKCFKQNAN